MTIEYRRIGRLPTCIGNERIRIAAGGEVSHSRNTVECEPGVTWSAPWRPVGRLDAAALARLTQQIIDTGILGLEPESIDETVQGERARKWISQSTNASTTSWRKTPTLHRSARSSSCCGV